MTQLLGDILKGPGTDSVVAACRVLGLWQKAAEGETSSHTQALKLEKGTLFVEVDNSVWLQELTFLRQEFADKINKLAGSKVVGEIRFIIKRS